MRIVAASSDSNNHATLVISRTSHCSDVFIMLIGTLVLVLLSLLISRSPFNWLISRTVPKGAIKRFIAPDGIYATKLPKLDLTTDTEYFANLVG